MEKLQPMTDFVLEQSKRINDPEILARLFVSYATFLKQHLTLGMFVPCDADGNVLEEPKREHFLTESMICRTDDYTKAIIECREAKHRVLFEVTKEFLESNIYDENGFFYTLEIVEDLIASHNNYNLVLTESAKKQIGI